MQQISIYIPNIIVELAIEKSFWYSVFIYSDAVKDKTPMLHFVNGSAFKTLLSHESSLIFMRVIASTF